MNLHYRPRVAVAGIKVKFCGYQNVEDEEEGYYSLFPNTIYILQVSEVTDMYTLLFFCI